MALSLVVLACALHTVQNPVVIGATVQFQSKTLHESRTLLISKPAGYDSGTDRYPVLYLLDGERHFPYTATIADFLGENDRIPKMLVVGIVSGDTQKRTHDLTPPSTAEIDNRFSPGGGGADAFLSFLANDLIPFIDRTYRTRPYRAIAGHSFGGLFALYALIKNPTLFNGYIAADPSLHWNNQAVVAEAQSFFERTAALQKDFYLSAADASHRVPRDVEVDRCADPVGSCRIPVEVRFHAAGRSYVDSAPEHLPRTGNDF